MAKDIELRLTLQSILASAPGPDPDGGVEVSDEEFDAFLKALRS